MNRIKVAKHMAGEEETIRQLILELRLLESSATVLQSRLTVIESALGEILVASSTLEGIKSRSKGSETLIPIGAGSFVRAELADAQRIIMGVGAGVCIEKTVEDSIAELRNRMGELEKARGSLQQQLRQTVLRLEDGRAKLGELARKRSGETR